MKKCPKCLVEKELTEFGKDKQKLDGLNSYCKTCIRKRSQVQRENDSEYHLKYAKEYRKNNRDLLRKKGRERFKAEREKCLEKSRKSYYRHKIDIAKRRKIKRSSEEARKKENERQKRYRKKDPKKYRSYTKKWQQKNKQKHCAHQRVHRTVKDGILKRSKCCEECGMICKTEGHHEDYSKPLEVKWLCRKCHASRIETVEV